MSAFDLLDIVVHVVFIAIGVLALLDFLRHRDPVRRDVAILFAILAVPFLLQFIARLQGVEESDGASSLGLIALLIEPYLLVRLLRYLRSTPSYAIRVALYSLIVTILVGIIIGPRIQIVSTVIGAAYLVGINLYAAIGFVRGALRSTGVAQQRLRFTAAGAGFFGLTLGAIVLAGSIIQEKVLLALLGETFAIISVLAFYVGFVPPRWLRRMWQLAEAENYLTGISRKPMEESTQIAEIGVDICLAARRSVGAIAAGVVRKNDDNQQWNLLYADDASKIPWDEAASSALENDNKSPRYVRASKQMAEGVRHLLTSVGADSVLVVPMDTTTRSWGLLLVFLQYGSLFIEDDLHLVSLLTEQSAIVLENVELIESLRRQARSLQEQSANITAVNKELEAFSYSVSHDLRAPLRAVDGFSQALLEDYDDVLDDMGRDFLHRIRTESQRMGKLIDDLIGLSRFTRMEMKVTRIDLSTMARDVAADLTAKEPERVVEFSIQNDVEGCGDEGLVRVALANLMGNAWKYSSKKAAARIEFGCQNINGVAEYYVRDNGAGFDMAYANKLFGAFQRLHAMDEFDGTGIGLATVQRIMHRHGGTARAEGVVNEGATFYFTLGSRNRV